MSTLKTLLPHFRTALSASVLALAIPFPGEVSSHPGGRASGKTRGAAVTWMREKKG